MSGLVEATATALERALAMAGLGAYRGPLVLAVSGGPDSLAMLDILARLYPPARLIVAHLDHGLRPDSAREAAAVAHQSDARGLAFHLETADVAALARERRLSLEEAGRVARYDFLARVARGVGAAAIVVGHNAGDQTETILMHLLRGAGVAGLRGMAAAAPLPGRSDLWLLRPLLDTDRDAIEDYCRQAGLEPAADASNADLTFLRNRLRHELLPLLQTYNPQLAQRLREMGAILGAEDDLLAQLEEEAWRAIALPRPSGGVALRREAWQKQPLALRRRLLRRAAALSLSTPTDLSFSAIEAARRLAERRATGGRADLPGELVVAIGYETIEFRHAATAPAGDWPQLRDASPFVLAVPGEVALAGGWSLSSVPVPAPDRDAIAHNRDPWTAYVAVEPTLQLVVRPRLPGERVRPLGLGGSARLKEVMINRKIPAAARALWPVVATAIGPLWLAGHVLDEGARVSADSLFVVRLRCQKTA